MTTLITGATGFLGGALAKKLAEGGAHAGSRLRALVRASRDASALEALGVEVVRGDIADRDAVAAAVRGCARVYHVAAIYRSANHPDSYYEAVNTEAVRHVLGAARAEGCERVVHCSTIGVHGDCKEIPATESTPFNPGDIYQRTKLAGEMLAREAMAAGQPVTVFRPAGIYGPGDLRFLKLYKTIQTKKFIMFGDGKAHYHQVYIDDLVDGIVRCMTVENAAGGTYILAGPDYLSIGAMADHIADILGLPRPKLRLPLGPLLAASVVCEAVCKAINVEPPLYKRRCDPFWKERIFLIDKARAELGYDPAVTMRDGMTRTARWYIERGHLSRPKSGPLAGVEPVSGEKVPAAA